MNEVFIPTRDLGYLYPSDVLTDGKRLSDIEAVECVDRSTRREEILKLKREEEEASQAVIQSVIALGQF